MTPDYYECLFAPVSELHDEFEEAMASWSWLLPQPGRLLAMSALGDPFIVMPDGLVTFLRTDEGELIETGEGPSIILVITQDHELVEDFFIPRFVKSLVAKWGQLESGECFSPTVPTVLGGRCETANFTRSRFSAHLHTHGQILRQVKALPPGTKIGKIKVEPW